jgi:hypothetical protein
MPEPSHRSAVASSPLSVLLFAHALSTDTQDSLQTWRQYLGTLGRAYEIVLIQETRPEVPTGPFEDLAESAKPTHTFSYERSQGFRDALNEAIRSARHPLLAICPADKQYLPSDLGRMLKVIDKVDLVTGYRCGGQAPPWRVALDTLVGLFSRIVIGAALEPRTCWLGCEGWGRRWVARWIFGVRVVDPECPFRLARREVFEHLPIQSSGPFVQVEILAKANHLSCYLAEEPVTWTAPVEPTSSDGVTFGQDALLVFRAPDFGPFDGSDSALKANGPRDLGRLQTISKPGKT